MNDDCTSVPLLVYKLLALLEDSEWYMTNTEITLNENEIPWRGSKNDIIPNLRCHPSDEAAEKSAVHLMETGFDAQRVPTCWYDVSDCLWFGHSNWMFFLGKKTTDQLVQSMKPY